MKKPEIVLRLLKIPLDFCAVLGAFLLSYILRANPDVMSRLDLQNPLLLPFENFVWFSVQASALLVLIFALEGLYSLKKSYRFRKEIRRMLLLSGAAYTIIILYFFLVGIQFFSRFILGLSFLLSVFFMVTHRTILRLVQHALWKRGIGRRRVVFLGTGLIFEELSKRWSMALGFEIVGRVSSLEQLQELTVQEEIDEVVQVSTINHAAEVVEYCQLQHIEYRFVPDLLEVQRINTEMDFVGNIPIITLRSSAIDGWGRVIKRACDVLGGILGLVMFSPFFFLIAVGIKLQDAGPIFYKSLRVSRGREFWMWKFRSMIPDADQKKKELLDENRREGPLFKIQDDPRITRFGKFLRKTSLDELPQLWNVLLGDMSLVGPRAHLPEEIAQYERHHRKVLSVKSGITGLSQISGRSKLPFEEEIKLDVYYLENWSLPMDMKIVLRTFGVLLDGE